MPRVQYTADGGYYRVGGYGFDPGDEKDVDEELAEYLADHDDFDVVDDVGSDDSDDDADTDTSADAADAEAVSEPDQSGFDVDAFLDRNVGPIADDISAAKPDALLDTVAEAADRVTVQDAVGERRAEVEG